MLIILCHLDYVNQLHRLQRGVQLFLLPDRLLFKAGQMLDDHYRRDEHAAQAYREMGFEDPADQGDGTEKGKGDDAPSPVGLDFDQGGKQNIQKGQDENGGGAGQQAQQHAEGAGDGFSALFRLKGARAWPRTGASINGAIMGLVKSPPDRRQAINTGRKPLPMSSARHSSPIFQPQ